MPREIYCNYDCKVGESKNLELPEDRTFPSRAERQALRERMHQELLKEDLAREESARQHDAQLAAEFSQRQKQKYLPCEQLQARARKALEVGKLRGAASTPWLINWAAFENVPIPALPDASERQLVLDDAQAELLVAEWMRYLGWADAVRTPRSNDGGIDVVAESSGGLGVQVKFEAVKSGRPALQRLWGACHAKGIMSAAFATSAGYSVQARDYARTVGMSLFTFTRDGRLAAANEQASRLVQASRDKAENALNRRAE